MSLNVNKNFALPSRSLATSLTRLKGIEDEECLLFCINEILILNLYFEHLFNAKIKTGLWKKLETNGANLKKDTSQILWSVGKYINIMAVLVTCYLTKPNFTWPDQFNIPNPNPAGGLPYPSPNVGNHICSLKKILVAVADPLKLLFLRIPIFAVKLERLIYITIFFDNKMT